MLAFLPRPITKLLSYMLFSVNLVIWVVIFFYPVLLVKIILSPTPWRNHADSLLTKIGECWVRGNNWVIGLTQNIEWDIQADTALNREESPLITANHQSWIDIIVIQKLFVGRAPFPRFFIKQQLIWVPLLGLCWWGLDFPFMRRFSREYLAKHPEMKGKDLEATRRACQRFRYKPVSVINFFEGTRFTAAKHERQQSPFQHLLKPRAGGAAFTLNAMDGAITKLVDVTIVYPQGNKAFTDLFANRINKIIVRLRSIDIPERFIHGDYENDPVFKAEIQAWINQLWEDKDRQIAELLERESGT